ncbi:hypothetical protein M0811_04962 [Anaeramoeba ignava]|uniref:Phosphatidic acid phosphatase type 2/haloperoxidase domain-containing protein n=1 Tax=Anaeramoeba ignava TaxID=1746090 RepID=A0A9Q0RFI5_ANAIG|nr:hypothetical protein M0811_04962 [Anaeramoeba ignava]
MTFLQEFSQSIPYCDNQINNNFFNKCFKQVPTGGWTVLGEVVNSWMAPRTISLTLTLLIFSLPMILLGSRKKLVHSNQTIYRFFKMKFIILNFLHRICYGLTLDVMLLSIFRQNRPCNCDLNGSGKSQFGSIYGMPSGDALTGGIVGIFLIDEKPFYPLYSRILGGLIMFLVAIERVGMGYHSVGQVTTGIVVGSLLHFYSKKTPQYITFVDSFVQIVFGFVFLRIDKSLDHFKKNDSNNLYAWLIFGIAFVVFESLNMFQNENENENNNEISETSSQEIENETFINEQNQLLLSDAKEIDTWKTGDYYWMLITVFVQWFIVAISIAWEQYAWI